MARVEANKPRSTAPGSGGGGAPGSADTATGGTATSAAAAAPAKAKQAPAVHTPKRSATVTVACKIPTGIVMQLCEESSYEEETPGGSRTRKRFDRVGDRVIIRGPANPVGQAPKGFRRAVVVGGYGLTQGVNADFFDKWMEQNKKNPIVVNHMIFAHSRSENTIAEAKEKSELRSGFEPMVPDNDPRMPRPIGAGVTPVHTAEEQAGRAGPDENVEQDQADAELEAMVN